MNTTSETCEKISSSLKHETEVTEGSRKILEEIMTENSLNLMKSLNPLI